MQEGCIDLYTAVKRCIIDGDFNWKEYGEQKLIGVLISVVTLGMGGLKAAFKGLSKGTQAIAKVSELLVNIFGSLLIDCPEDYWHTSSKARLETCWETGNQNCSQDWSQGLFRI